MNGRWPGIGVSRAAGSNLWTPADMPGILMWMDGSDVSKFNLNVSNVSSWSSSVGSVTYTQGAGALQPARIAGGIYSAGDQYMRSDNMVYPAGTGDWTFVVILTGANPAVTNAVGVGINQNWTTGFAAELSLTDRAAVNVNSAGANNVAAPGRMTNPQVVTGARRGNNFQVVNSNNNLSATVGSTLVLPFQAAPSFIDAYMFDGSAVQAWGSTGYYYQIALASGTASVADVERLQGSMAWKAGAQAQLHAGHPYRNAAPTK